MKKLVVILAALFVVMGFVSESIASITIYGVWDWEISEPVHVLVSPGGGGTALTNAAYFGGTTVDATIRFQLWVIASWELPVPANQFPAEDVWLYSPGLISCIGGANPDGESDEDGWMTFTQPLSMGGSTDIDAGPPYMFVMINGTPLDDLTQIFTPTIVVNSPDINGDLLVNLVDLGLFSTDFFGEYDYRSDFYWDGVLDLADVGRFALMFGTNCP